MWKQSQHANGTRLGQRTPWTNVFVRAASPRVFSVSLISSIAGTHCPVIHEPPLEHNFIFTPENSSALTLLQSKINNTDVEFLAHNYHTLCCLTSSI